MCDITPLLEFKVYGTGDTPRSEFIPNRTCNQIQDKFEQLCLVVPTTRMQSTCSPLEQLQSEPESFFQQIIAGEIDTLVKLPRIFQSFTKEDSQGLDSVWRGLTPQEQQTVVDFGFKQILTSFSKFATTTGGSIFLSFAQSSSTTQVLQLYKLDDVGLLRSQQPLLQVDIEDYSTEKTRVVLQDQGNFAFAIVNQVLYAQLLPSNVATTAWTRVFAQETVIQDVLVHNDTIIAVPFENALVVLSPTTFSPIAFVPLQANNLRILWTCFSPDFAYFLVGSTLPASGVILFTLFSSAQPFTLVRTWSLAAQQTFEPYASSCMIDNVSTTNIMRVLVTNNNINNTNIAQTIAYTLSATMPTVIANAQPVFLFGTRFFGAFYINAQGFIKNARTQHIFPMPSDQSAFPANSLNPFTTTELSVSNDNLWVSVLSQDAKSQIWQLNATNSTWTKLSNTIFADFGAELNDEEVPGMSDFLPWYNGASTFSIPASSELKFPGSNFTSRHLHYRWMFDSVDKTSFAMPFITSHLEVANEFAILSNSRFIVRFYDDANIIVAQGPDFAWQTNTHDRSSDSTVFQIWEDKTKPLVTFNGLYVLFLVESGQKSVVRIAYNVYNNPRFTYFCRQDEEFATRALKVQSDFCFANFQVQDQEDKDAFIQFADTRCACLGDRRLLENVFPAFASDAGMAGQLAARLPCLLGQCGSAILASPAEITNVYDYVAATCGKAGVNVCADTIAIGANGKFNLNAFQLLQNCGTDPTACLKNEECLEGFICVDGHCVPACNTDEMCYDPNNVIQAKCENATGRCVFPQNARTTQTNLTWQVILGVTLALALILLVVMIAVFVR